MSDGAIVKRTHEGLVEKGQVLNPKGNKNRKRQSDWTKKFYAALRPSEFAAVVQELLNAAKRGEKWAVIEVMNRCLGRVVQTVDATVEHNVPVERRIYNVLNILGIPTDTTAESILVNERPPSPESILVNERPKPAEDQLRNSVPVTYALPAPVAPVPQEVHGVGEEQARGGDVDGRAVERKETADK